MCLSCSLSDCALRDRRHNFHASVYLCLCDRTHVALSEFKNHNRRKLHFCSTKPEVLLQKASVGSSPLCYGVKALDLKAALVRLCSKSERGSGRCPRRRLHYNPEFRGRVADSQLREAGGCEVDPCRVIASQA